jgi:hypothetical protein
MSRRVGLFLAMILVLVLSAACEGGTSGSVSGSSERCSSGGSGGTCSGKWKRLTGTYSKDVENDSIFSGDAIAVEVQVSVEAGTVRVSLEDPDGEVTSVDVAPGGTETLAGFAKGDFDAFDVRFQAVDGEATGVSWEIAYQIP